MVLKWENARITQNVVKIRKLVLKTVGRGTINENIRKSYCKIGTIEKVYSCLHSSLNMKIYDNISELFLD